MLASGGQARGGTGLGASSTPREVPHANAMPLADQRALGVTGPQESQVRTAAGRTILGMGVPPSSTSSCNPSRERSVAPRAPAMQGGGTLQGLFVSPKSTLPPC